MTTGRINQGADSGASPARRARALGESARAPHGGHRPRDSPGPGTRDDTSAAAAAFRARCYPRASGGDDGFGAAPQPETTFKSRFGSRSLSARGADDRQPTRNRVEGFLHSRRAPPVKGRPTSRQSTASTQPRVHAPHRSPVSGCYSLAELDDREENR